jgi:hypothetical protein
MKHATAQTFWADYSGGKPSLPWTTFFDFFATEFMEEDMTEVQEQALREAIGGMDGDGTITTRAFDRWAAANKLGESWSAV